MLSLTVERHEPSSHTILMELPDGVAPRDWSQTFLLRSDAHHDSVHCNRTLELRHLKQAKERNAGILDFGDCFDVMQGNWDPRKSKGELRPEYCVPNYLDALTDDAASFYAPYADNFVVIIPGNHETAISKKHEHDLTQALVTKLNKHCTPPHQIYRASYAGYLTFRIRTSVRTYTTMHMAYTHGYGGGGPVTKGTIQANRRAVYHPDARVLVSGHVHEQWNVDYMQHRINSVGRQYLQLQEHICIPGYKEEYLGSGSQEGWHIQRGAPPKPTGAWWMKLSLSPGRSEFVVELTKAL